MRLPDGDSTTNAEVYVEEWHKLITPIEKFFDMVCCAYDPDISLSDKLGSKHYTISVKMAQKIVRYICVP